MHIIDLSAGVERIAKIIRFDRFAQRVSCAQTADGDRFRVLGSGRGNVCRRPAEALLRIDDTADDTSEPDSIHGGVGPPGPPVRAHGGCHLGCWSQGMKSFVSSGAILRSRRRGSHPRLHAWFLWNFAVPSMMTLLYGICLTLPFRIPYSDWSLGCITPGYLNDAVMMQRGPEAAAC